MGIAEEGGNYFQDFYFFDFTETGAGLQPLWWWNGIGKLYLMNRKGRNKVSENLKNFLEDKK